MKKILGLMLVLLLTGLSALAVPNDEAEETIFALEGVVIEVSEDSYLIESEIHGPVQILFNEETIFDTSRDIAIGDYIYTVYNGMMSRSIPAQITAELVRMYAISGKIISADPEVSGVLLETETHGEVYAYLPEPWLENTAETITVYFDGAMTMSLPPQISGNYVIPAE